MAPPRPSSPSPGPPAGSPTPSRSTTATPRSAPGPSTPAPRSGTAARIRPWPPPPSPTRRCSGRAGGHRQAPAVPGAGTDLDAEFRPEPGDTVERIYVHLIQETARHDGHADILREQLDGTTGT